MKSDFKNQNAVTRWSHACRAQSAAVDLVRGLRVSLCAGESNDEVCVHKLRLQQAGLFGNTLSQVLCKADPAWPPPCLTWFPSSQCS